MLFVILVRFDEKYLILETSLKNKPGAIRIVVVMCGTLIIVFTVQ